MKRLLWLTGAALLVAWSSELAAQTAPPFDRIEEDWELVISEPSPEDEAPQILNVISPGSGGDFYLFEVNHSTQPDYTAGGMQLQRWTGESLRYWSTHPNFAQLCHPNETIRYTLRMRLVGSKLYVSVRNGESQTWGSFDGGSLWMGSDTTLANLNGYSTANSTAKSRIGFASYRVTRFVLKEVRYYSNGELVQTDETDRVVHEYQP